MQKMVFFKKNISITETLLAMESAAAWQLGNSSKLSFFLASIYTLNFTLGIPLEPRDEHILKSMWAIV